MPNLFNTDFSEFLKLLEGHIVDFLLVGGYAVILHIYIRSTGDLALWINKTSNNYTNLKKACQDFGAPMFSEIDFENDKFDVWSIGVAPRKIEILTHVDGLVFNQSKIHCKWFELEKFKVPYINSDDLIKNKLATGRYKDLADIEQLKKKKD